MKKIALLILLAGVVITTSSCCGCRKAKSIPMTGTSWELIEIGGKSVDRSKAEADSYSLILGQEGKFNGRGDCNRYTGSYDMDEKAGTVRFNNPATTRMMCLDQQGENNYIAMLDKAVKFKVDGNILILSDSNNDTLAVYRKMD